MLWSGSVGEVRGRETSLSFRLDGEERVICLLPSNVYGSDGPRAFVLAHMGIGSHSAQMGKSRVVLGIGTKWGGL